MIPSCILPITVKVSDHIVDGGGGILRLFFDSIRREGSGNYGNRMDNNEVIEVEARVPPTSNLR